jgi:cytochrome c553
MKKFLKVAALTGAMLSTSFTAMAADKAAGKAKSATCVACHGAAGCSPADIWPNLAGQKKGYLEKQLKDFKAGNRKDASMTAMVAALSEKDMANLAAYYNSLAACK